MTASEKFEDLQSPVSFDLCSYKTHPGDAYKIQ